MAPLPYKERFISFMRNQVFPLHKQGARLVKRARTGGLEAQEDFDFPFLLNN